MSNQEQSTEVPAEKLAEFQKDLNALLDKHGVELKIQQKNELVVSLRQEKPEEVKA